jgi:hypothetical protein
MVSFQALMQLFRGVSAKFDRYPLMEIWEEASYGTLLAFSAGLALCSCYSPCAELIPHNASAKSLAFWDSLRGTNPEVSQLNLTKKSKRKWRLSAPSLSTETTC